MHFAAWGALVSFCYGLLMACNCYSVHSYYFFTFLYDIFSILNNRGYGLRDGFDLCASDTDWCAVARCGHKCHKTSDGSWFTCSCRHGYVLNQDKKTCTG